jgi:hypothetical protein
VIGGGKSKRFEEKIKQKVSRKKNARSALRVKFLFLRLFTYQLLHMNTKGRDTSFGFIRIKKNEEAE